MKKGPLNKISDVKGVSVGHVTIDTEDNKTGLTVIMPSRENIFKHKLMAASHVINGFGKTAGLVQINELGTLESPIALTNTLNIGLVHEGLVDYMINRCKDEGVDIKSFNPVVGECNDSYLNDIHKRAIKSHHVKEAIDNACIDFQEGDIGCGKGTSCHQLKGGVGSSSRLIEIGESTYTLGVLVQSNHGRLEDLVIDGKNLGREILNSDTYKKLVPNKSEDTSLDKGSIMIVIATDLPLSDRQLKRICKRTSVGLARLGSYIGHGSGEIVIGFSTAQTISDDTDIQTIKILKEEKLEQAFKATADAVEEAILKSMKHAKTVYGIDGHVRLALEEFDL